MYMLKVNDGITRKRCEICSKLTIKTPERRHGDSEQLFVHAEFEELFVCLNLVCYALYEVAFSAYKKK